MTEAVQTAPTAASKAKVCEALLCLGKAIQKSTIYPETHPAVPAAVGKFLESLGPAMEDRASLSFGVAKDRILLDGEGIDVKNPGLSWLAHYLYARGIGLFEVGRNPPAGEAVRFVQWVARSEPGAEVVGELPRFEGITLTHYDYTCVRFGEDPAADSESRNDPVRVWVALMTGLMGGGSGESARDLRDLDQPEAFAREFSERLREGSRSGAPTAASRIVALGGQIAKLADPVREAVRQKLACFIGGLAPELRRELLRVDPGSSRQKLEFVNEIADALPPGALLEVIGDLDRTGGRIPHQFVTLVNKLIGLSSGDGALKNRLQSSFDSLGVSQDLFAAQPEKVKEILQEVFQSRLEKNWNPEHYQTLLEQLSGSRIAGASEFASDRFGDPRQPEQVRAHVSRIALNLLLSRPEAPEATGFVRCLDQDAPHAIESGRFEQVYESASAVQALLGSETPLAPDLTEASRTYLGGFSDPGRIERVIEAATRTSERDLPAHLAGLFQIAGSEASYLGLRRLSEGLEGPQARCLTLMLARSGVEAVQSAVARLRTEGWSALRGLFPVLELIGGPPAIELALTFVGNEDPRIRLEAFKVLMTHEERPVQLERYVERALTDESPRVVALALNQIRSKPSSHLVHVVATLLRRETGGWQEETRLRAIAVLGGLAMAEARDALIGMLKSRKVSLWVKHFRITQALEEALAQIGDEPSRAALRAWRRSPSRWISILLVTGKVKK